VDYCPVTPDTVIEKYDEVRQAPAPELVFTIKRQATGEQCEVVVVRQRLDQTHYGAVTTLQCKPAARRGSPSWQVLRRVLDDGVVCFVLAIDAGFAAEDVPDFFSKLTKAGGCCDWQQHVSADRYERAVLHCIVVRPESPSPKIESSTFGRLSVGLTSILPAARNLLFFDEASLRVTREATWMDEDLRSLLASAALSFKPTPAAAMIAQHLAQHVLATVGGDAKVDNSPLGSNALPI